MKLRELGEDLLLAQLFRDFRPHREVIVGPGDDCAVLSAPGKGEYLLLKSDCVVEGVHFRPNENARAVGWKAMMRTLSDFAAMSGVPRHALVTLVISSARESSWVKRLYSGLQAAADRFDVSLAGGETSATRGPLVLVVSAAGVVEKKRCVLRSGGKAGDALFVTGKLGGSGKGRHLRFIPRIEEARWLTRNFEIHAMMDVSDGLGADLPRLAKASRLAFEIDQPRIPRNRGCTIADAMNDGEDYELLFAISPNDAARLEKKWKTKFPRLALTRIGALKHQTSRVGPEKTFHGYVHFR
jgi:thiamine-monophosphate kinase